VGEEYLRGNCGRRESFERSQKAGRKRLKSRVQGATWRACLG
jgi:hypothetical protein